MFKKRKRVAVGVDIGSRAIKVVALEGDGSKRKPRLKGYSVTATPRATESPSDKALAEVVRKGVADVGADDKHVRASISGNTVVVRYIRMPQMALEELRSAIRYEAGQHIPFDVKDVELDCAILRPSTNGDGKMDVMLVAARKNACEHVMAILKAAGLGAQCIDADPVAMINAFTLSGAGEPDKPMALLNIGAKHSTVSILQGGMPTFTRSIEIGGEGLSLAIARGLGVEPEEAERLKVFGDPLVQPHLTMVLNSIVRQVRTSFDYFEGLAGRTVAELYLSGGTSLLVGLPEFLGEALGVPVREWSPLGGIDTAEFADDEKLQAVAPTLDVAVGLAARCVEAP
jgi:type IV pilus assembly protein PilM